MLLAAAALLAGAAGGWLTGRRPPAGGGRWRMATLIPLGAVLLLAGSRWVPGSAGAGVMAAGYGLLVAFAAANAGRPGLVLMAAGLLANLVVTVADHGMPVRGLPAGVDAPGRHHGLGPSDHLAALSDTIRVAPLGETVSPGDLLLASGGLIAVVFWLEPRPRPRTGRAGGARTP